RAAWGRPLGDLAARRVEPTQVTAREVGVPDDVVARDRDAPWARAGIRQRILANLQRLRVDHSDLVHAKLNEEHHALRIDRHAVGPRFRRGWRKQLDLAALRIEPPDP